MNETKYHAFISCPMTTKDEYIRKINSVKKILEDRGYSFDDTVHWHTYSPEFKSFITDKQKNTDIEDRFWVSRFYMPERITPFMYSYFKLVYFCSGWKDDINCDNDFKIARWVEKEFEDQS